VPIEAQFKREAGEAGCRPQAREQELAGTVWLLHKIAYEGDRASDRLPYHANKRRQNRTWQETTYEESWRRE